PAAFRRTTALADPEVSLVATYTRVADCAATSCGGAALDPAGRTRSTESLAASMTDTPLVPEFATNNLTPSGLMSSPFGLVPTAMVAATLLLVVEIFETVPDPLLVTYTALPSGVATTRAGA